MPRLSHALISLLLIPALLALGVPADAASASTAAATAGVTIPHWSWPVAGGVIVSAPFRAPAHEYGAGHRGIDLAAEVAAVVSAPAAGTVAFRGTVVDRPLLTIDHGGGYVSTFEPLLSTLTPGDVVSAGEPIGRVSVGGHTSPGALHVGARLDGTYINPLLLFGEVERAVLLPCCGPS